MSPQRPSARTSTTSKPYTRSFLSPFLPMEDLNDTTLFEGLQSPEMNESSGQSGLPTRAQYGIIERGYIESLTPRRQGKALISQALFDRIWDVLHNNDSAKETAQFRFWVRKMFTLSKSHTLYGESQPMDQEVLLHDGLLVAVREQIYELLCCYHTSTNHGGRDKTCALIRKHYTWVPKDLVAQFTKACPTCISKRYGRPDGALTSPRLEALSASPALPSVVRIPETPKQESASRLPPFKGYMDDVDDTDVSSNSFSRTPVAPHSQFVFNRSQPNGTSTGWFNHLGQFPLNNSDMSPGFPMMNEVSLHKGLTDGSQYRNIRYKSAHAECVEPQRAASIMPYDPSFGHTRHRIPGITPFKSDFEDIINFKAEGKGPAIDSPDFTSTLSPAPESYNVSSISPMLGCPATSPTIGGGSPTIPVDPLLLGFSISMCSLSHGGVSPVLRRALPLSGTLTARSDIDILASPRFPSSGPENVDDIGASGPPVFNLESWDSVKTFRDFLAVRENLNSGPLTEGQDSKANCHCWGNADKDEGNESGDGSPTSSVGSDMSGLSLVAGASSTGSPTSFSTSITSVGEGLRESTRIIGASRPSSGGGGSVNLNGAIRAVCVCGVEA